MRVCIEYNAPVHRRKSRGNKLSMSFRNFIVLDFQSVKIKSVNQIYLSQTIYSQRHNLPLIVVPSANKNS